MPQGQGVGLSPQLWTTRLLAAHARQHGPSAGHPSLGKLAQGTVCKILAEHEVEPHKVRYYLEQRDPEFEPKMAEILCVYRQVALLRAEEKNQGQARHSLLRRETRDPGDRYDRAGSPATARHQPNRDA